jgi:hypothetical protein
LVVVVVLVWEVEAGVVVVYMAFVLVGVAVEVVEEAVVVEEVDEVWEASVVLPSWVAVISPPLVAVAAADTDYNRMMVVVDSRIRSLDNRRVDTLEVEVVVAA